MSTDLIISRDSREQKLMDTEAFLLAFLVERRPAKAAPIKPVTM
jgi:hypothetical protein